MQSSSMKREISEAHNTIRFGINAGVKADLAPPHPLQSTIQSVRIRRSPSFRGSRVVSHRAARRGGQSRWPVRPPPRGATDSSSPPVWCSMEVAVSIGTTQGQACSTGCSVDNDVKPKL
ncbi:hypothetical protein ZEAMMB73_Zm00001d044133 [Zea mays]|jgi:hypothetical protein|uniref:Uncharacterized protein n=1 Tax=Zea mays TaxID=4577 RepID=A0A1D6NI24_MAIZE|nr:hypothetical protein ZEAMMB73_Zm00001d044133 [Zea mays]ONM40023.1 hypothetical protein ZEAMMB73_Zm00001d044133 [Zea mays]